MGCWFFSNPNVGVALALVALLLCSAPLSFSVPAPPPPDYTGEDGDDTSMTKRDGTDFFLLFCLSLGILFLLLLVDYCLIDLLTKRTVIKFQVVLSARGGDIGTSLHDTAASARDFAEAMKGTIKALVGEQHNFIYGSTSVKVRRGMVYSRHLGDLASKEMEKLEIQRVRLENGQLVPKLGPKQKKDYTFVTILVAVDGAHRLPSVEGSSEEMRDALNYLDIKLNKILKAEVLWGYKDPFAAQGLLESFPDLKSFVA